MASFLSRNSESRRASCALVERALASSTIATNYVCTAGLAFRVDQSTSLVVNRNARKTTMKKTIIPFMVHSHSSEFMWP